MPLHPRPMPDPANTGTTAPAAHLSNPRRPPPAIPATSPAAAATADGGAVRKDGGYRANCVPERRTHPDSVFEEFAPPHLLQTQSPRCRETIRECPPVALAQTPVRA